MHRLGTLARDVGGEVIGSPDTLIGGVAPFEEAGPTDITLALKAEYARGEVPSQAAAWIIGTDVEHVPVPAIRVENPRLAFAHLLARFAPNPPMTSGIHPTAVVGAGVELAADVTMGPNVTVGAGARLGRGV